MAAEAGILTLCQHDRSFSNNQSSYTVDLGTGDAMTDCQWDKRVDLKRILLGSADGYAYLYNLDKSSSPLACFDSGGEAVKVGRWCDHVIAIGGRDGAIRLFDTRTASRSSRLNEPVLMIAGAHRIKPQGPGLISSLSFLNENHLLSIGQPNYNVLVWDKRFTKTSKPVDYFENPTSHGKRTRAFIDICHLPDASAFVAVNSNHHIYKVNAANMCVERDYWHPEMFLNSFYLRAQSSPDGLYLACGSSGKGAVWIFNSDCRNNIDQSNDKVCVLEQDASDIIEGQFDCTGVAWHPTGDMLACSLDSGLVTQWGEHTRRRDGTVFQARLIDTPKSDEYCNTGSSCFSHSSQHYSNTGNLTPWPLDPPCVYNKPGKNETSMFDMINLDHTKTPMRTPKRSILDYFSSSERASPVKKRIVM